jgi:hypothetical protein
MEGATWEVVMHFGICSPFVQAILLRRLAGCERRVLALVPGD